MTAIDISVILFFVLYIISFLWVIWGILHQIFNINSVIDNEIVGASRVWSTAMFILSGGFLTVVSYNKVDLMKFINGIIVFSILLFVNSLVVPFIITLFDKREERIRQRRYEVEAAEREEIKRQKEKSERDFANRLSSEERARQEEENRAKSRRDQDNHKKNQESNKDENENNNNNSRRDNGNNSDQKFKDALELFELPPIYDLKQLQGRRKQLLLRVHPDHGGSNAMARMVNEAFDLLKSKI
ncbi:hypothetical protein [Jiella avicenniae]|uniref:J domain-containing protein n=1 Tax=Jiella avicenniae TaxID=2907202 RepID=A0A9X1P5N9_9HYPH|nr:hypothetical protein [Jiella avicenniae]MCE7030998.1 hypothetical protein [Jiella avicenniae]